MDNEQFEVSAKKESDGATRRELFQIGNALLWPVLLGGSAAKGATGGPLTPGPEIYQSIGVEPVINCRGTFTIIGASVETPETRAAMEYATRYFVQYDELAEGVGRRLARVDRRRVGDGLGRLRGGAETRHLGVRGRRESGEADPHSGSHRLR